MSGRPKTIREAITYLYDALDIASRPASWVAHALQVIETEAERIEAENARLRQQAEGEGER